MTIWFNPACSKCRKTKELLEFGRCPITLFEYLSTPPSREQLLHALALLKKTPRDIVRSKEAIYSELALDDASDEQLLSAMVEHPKLIERPIVIAEERGTAVLARPPELSLQLLQPPLPEGTSAQDIMRMQMQGTLSDHFEADTSQPPLDIPGIEQP